MPGAARAKARHRWLTLTRVPIAGLGVVIGAGIEDAALGQCQGGEKSQAPGGAPKAKALAKKSRYLPAGSPRWPPQ